MSTTKVTPEPTSTVEVNVKVTEEPKVAPKTEKKKSGKPSPEEMRANMKMALHNKKKMDAVKSRLKIAIDDEMSFSFQIHKDPLNTIQLEVGMELLLGDEPEPEEEPKGETKSTLDFDKVKGMVVCLMSRDEKKKTLGLVTYVPDSCSFTATELSNAIMGQTLEESKSNTVVTTKKVEYPIKDGDLVQAEFMKQMREKKLYVEEDDDDDDMMYGMDDDDEW